VTLEALTNGTSRTFYLRRVDTGDVR
jgi:hypothetical protein